jgi:hypothetical protein
MNSIGNNTYASTYCVLITFRFGPRVDIRRPTAIAIPSGRKRQHKCNTGYTTGRLLALRRAAPANALPEWYKRLFVLFDEALASA